MPSFVSLCSLFSIINQLRQRMSRGRFKICTGRVVKGEEGRGGLEGGDGELCSGGGGCYGDDKERLGHHRQFRGGKLGKRQNGCH